MSREPFTPDEVAAYDRMMAQQRPDLQVEAARKIVSDFTLALDQFNRAEAAIPSRRLPVLACAGGAALAGLGIGLHNIESLLVGGAGLAVGGYEWGIVRPQAVRFAQTMRARADKLHGYIKRLSIEIETDLGTLGE